MDTEQNNSGDAAPGDEQPTPTLSMPPEDAAREDPADSELDDDLPELKRPWPIYVVIGLLAVAAVVVVGLFLAPLFPRAVITVNGDKISSADFGDTIRFDYYLQTGNQPLEQVGIDAVMFAEFSQEGMINILIVRQQAAERNITISDEDISEESRGAFGYDPADSDSEALAEENFTAFLDDFSTATGLTTNRIEALWYDRVEVFLLVDQLIDDLDLPIEETEVLVHAAHILVETREEVLDVIQLLEDGADFTELAVELSIDPGSAENGGDLGWFGPGTMIPEFEAAAFITPVGELSVPVQSQYGWHVIMVLERDEVPITDDQREQQEHEQFSLLMDEWRAEAEIVLVDNWTDYIPELP
jgi:parvulin-like peptidyl-prolyl isomerase